MKLEYLIFNGLVMIGPIIFSFDHKVHFVLKWPRVFMALTAPLVGFIGWDMLVTGRHWWFNPEFITGFTFGGLPIEEWLFFITVPFATLFIWEILKVHFNDKVLTQMRFLRSSLYFAIPVGSLLMLVGKEYTGLVGIALGLVAILDKILHTDLLLKFRTYQYGLFIIGLTLIFNGYLTSRPVVLYNENFQLGIRIFTIPIEDFFYGFDHLLSCTILYEKLK